MAKQQQLPPQPRQAPATSAKGPQGSSDQPPQGQAVQSPQSPSPLSRQAPPRQAHPPPKGDNPYDAKHLGERRRAALAQLREDRGVPPPKAAQGKSEAAEAPKATDATPEAPAASQAPAKASDAKPEAVAGTGESHLDVLKAQYLAREQAVAAAERKASEANTASEKRKAEIEALEAKNAAHLKRLEMVKNDPIQFFSESGLSEEDFKRYLAAGGKDTPEAARMRATEAALREVREELKAFKEENAKARTQAQRDREDAAFVATLASDDYAMVNNLGGIQVVRAKQAELAQTLSQPVTLAQAAGQLEKEFGAHFKTMLENATIRRKLGLSVEESAGSREQSPRTLNHAVSSSTSEANPPPAWNDWAAKKRRVMQELERANRN